MNDHRNNQVSLEIIKALIQSCHRDLNLFSKYVVKILCMMLGTQDLELIDLTCDTASDHYQQQQRLVVVE